MRLKGRAKRARKRTGTEVELDRAKYEKEVAEARESGEATKLARALNNLGTVFTDAGDHAEALRCYKDALAALDEKASTEDQVVSRGNAAQAARQLEEWETAMDYALESEALAIKHGYKKTLNESLAGFLLMRRTLGVERFTELFNAGLAKLPEDLRGHVRADLHLNPTYKKDTDTPGRNDPCPCGSGRKYKKCCGKA